ncbi:MAG: metallophosphoesterase family protein [Oscillospiraceae bacterium]|nr:metallophosphoesterase family protein [Oscillospiraceae bacterium]
MKILTISDEECPALWDYYIPGRLDGYDLIIACGDLKAKYLSFLVTMAKVPVLYVHGNHDGSYEHAPPEGCDCIDGEIVVYNGMRILGLGGCRKYHPGKYQYTESEMRRRIRRLWLRLKLLGGVDIVVTHAAPEGLGDAEDRAHWGFAALRELMDKYHPQLLVHGHVHASYGHDIPREIEYNGTRIINACERYVVELPDRPYDLRRHGEVIYKTRRRREDPFEDLVLK